MAAPRSHRPTDEVLMLVYLLADAVNAALFFIALIVLVLGLIVGLRGRLRR
jgi:hypothetical protein